MGIFIHALSPINRALNWFGHIKRWFALWITYISQQCQCNRPKVVKRQKIAREEKSSNTYHFKSSRERIRWTVQWSKKRTVQKTTRTLNSERECNKIRENLGNNRRINNSINWERKRTKTVLSTLINSFQISLEFSNFFLSFALILILCKFFRCSNVYLTLLPSKRTEFCSKHF